MGRKIQSQFVVMAFFVFSIALFLLLPSISHAASFATSTTSGGNWSATSTWVGGVVPGDGYFVTIQGPVVINQNIGTVGGGGIDRITLDAASSSLTNITSTPITIRFASTGNDPLGSGTASAPGTNATMFGILAYPLSYGQSTGLISLVGTPSDPVTLESASGTYTIYISSPNDAPFYNSNTNIVLKWVDMYDLGTSNATSGNDFNGITSQVSASGQILDIENCRFTNPYVPATLIDGSSYNFTFENNYITGVSGNNTIFTTGNGGGTVVNNTEVNPKYNGGYFFNAENGNNGLTLTGNAIEGTTTSTIGIYQSFDNSASSNNLFQYNLDYSSTTTEQQNFVLIVNNTSTLIDSNINEGSDQAADLSTEPGDYIIYSNNFDIIDPYEAPAQGTIILRKGEQFITNNIALSVSSSSGYFDYGSNATETAIYNHNTVVMPLTYGTSTAANCYDPKAGGVGIGNGEPGDSITNDIDKSNLIYGSPYSCGISTQGPTNSYASDYNGIGVHHNDVWGTSIGQSTSTLAQYYSESSTGYGANFGLGHPSSTYGDITANPNFVNPTRTSIVNYDSVVIGGPGTVADIFANLGYRSGWGGTYNTSTWGVNPINSIRQWLFAGYAPTNAVLSTAAADGGTDGAMSFVDTTPPVVTIVSPSSNAIVSSLITLTASSTDNVAVASVAFYEAPAGTSFGASTLIGSTTSSIGSLYSVTWNTGGVANGSTTIWALSTDTSSNTSAASTTVTVDNVSTPPPSNTPTIHVGVAASYASNTGPMTTTPTVTATSTSTTTSTTTTITTTTTSSSSLQSELNSLLAELASLESEAREISSVTFTQNLSLYGTGIEVHQLQIFLISQDKGPASQKLAEHGATYFFGMLTFNALVEYQKGVGISPASGYFGPITRAYINTNS